MKTKLLLSLPLVGCFAFVSCYPILDGPRGPRGPRDSRPDPNTTVASQDQQKIEEQRELMKERAKRQAEMARRTVGDLQETTVEKPKKTTTSDYAFANPVPGKEGFVFSPYNNKLVDVRDIPSGTLVQDPTYPASEKKYFRVP